MVRLKQSVRDGLDAEWLARKEAEVFQSGSSEHLPLLDGEVEHGHSVYKIVFDDGYEYVGVTGRRILTRMTQHLVTRKTPAIVEHVQTGVGYRFVCLLSGATAKDAYAAEKLHIEWLPKPLNSVNRKDKEAELERAGKLLNQLCEMMGFKVCHGCHKLLPANDSVFESSKRTISGIGPRCKDCKKRRKK